MLADGDKDASVVALFPELAWQWKLEVTDRENWEQFTLADFERLKTQFGVNWVVVSYPPPGGLTCPWHNGSVSVCKIP